ncbi:hypothetical protein BASA61_001346 [Batrachochytrium salamandrivorans]|nr:hypothetical protein BASA61_001346 [Batrachochytrium salamandrivorans]
MEFIEIKNTVLLKKNWQLLIRGDEGHTADPAVSKAIGDCHGFDLIPPRRNCKPDCLQDAHLVGIGHFVLHALSEKAVKTAPIVGLQVPDNSSIARLQL